MKQTWEEGKKYTMFGGRMAGKRTIGLQHFIEACDRGEKIVYKTPKGDIVSPALLESLLTQARTEALGEAMEIIKEMSGYNTELLSPEEGEEIIKRLFALSTPPKEKKEQIK